MKFTRFLSIVLPAALFICGCDNKNATNDRLNNAINQAQQGNWNTAGKEAAELSAALPNATAPMLLRALAYEKQGDLAKAIDLARQCVTNSPKDFTSHYTLGRLYSLDPKRDAEAFTVLEKAHSLKPDDTDTLVLLCNIGIKRHEPNTDKYLNLLMHKPEFSNSAQLYYMLGVRQAEKRNVMAAQRFMMNALNKSGNANNPDLIYRIALCFDQNKFPPKEIKKFYNLFLRSKGVKNKADIANARKRLRQL